jgi:copper chaperone CopZ
MEKITNIGLVWMSFLFLIFSGCQGNKEDVVIRKKHVNTQRKEIKIEANQKLTVQIEGMTCKMGCGGTIRKSLRKTGNVGRVRFDFQEGRKVQTATIYIDSTKITAQGVKDIIESLNDKQFSINEIRTEPFSKPKSRR